MAKKCIKKLFFIFMCFSFFSCLTISVLPTDTKNPTATNCLNPIGTSEKSKENNITEESTQKTKNQRTWRFFAGYGFLIASIGSAIAQIGQRTAMNSFHLNIGKTLERIGTGACVIGAVTCCFYAPYRFMTD